MQVLWLNQKKNNLLELLFPVVLSFGLGKVRGRQYTAKRGFADRWKTSLGLYLKLPCSVAVANM